MRFIKKNVKNLGSGQFRGSRTALWLRRCPVPSPPGCPCCVCPGGGCFLLPFRFGPFLKAEGNRLDVPDCSMNSSQAPQTMLHWRDKRFPSALRNGSKSSKASENTRPRTDTAGTPRRGRDRTTAKHKAVRLPRNCAQVVRAFCSCR